MEIFGINPSWDALILVSILIVAVYGFIVGESKTVKALFCAYPAFFVADLLSRFLPSLFPSLKIAFIQNDAITGIVTLSEQISSLQIVVGLKLLFFLIFFIALVRLPFIQIEGIESGKKLGNILLFAIVSLSFALLFVNILLLLYSGYSTVGVSGLSHVLAEIAPQSFLATVFVQYYGIFFALPAFIFLFSVFLYSPIDTEPDDEE